MKDAVYLFHPHFLNYKFDQDHPFDQHRITLTRDLLRAANAFPSDSEIVSVDQLDEEWLQAVHVPEYIESVKALSAAHPLGAKIHQAQKYGLNTEDTPFFPGMHQSAQMIAAASVEAAKLVMDGKTRHAINLAGGLHHAMPQRGSGFCVYNDASIAISFIRKQYGAKVLYVDTDAHHGDGVEMSFYSDPEVYTYSIHETGKYLFPGTGQIEQRGEGEGFGCTINLPMEPYTEDDSWLESFKNVLEDVLQKAKPDIIISQHGCDAHALDPLSHLHCSMRIYREMPRILHEAAHHYCDGRWVALGGGGYDIWRVVPRAWSLLWMEMSGHPLLQQIDADPFLRLPEAWLDRWSPQSPEELPQTWLDDISEWTPMPRRAEIEAANRRSVELASMYLR
ncbi:acetoin utilization protein AcuC [Saccharibacillus sp. JS10]|uniref:acetoin utilization protein AcuC n=1 Tax=Saccharibacillus sp. JS10 TaxID=2950552 RepID=UPI002108AA61|nr:acetoin utilization protein AcuC [Saccharibacillus sp. JS10]MCQ4085697.1 acetoin utilization protein AcuC [Saccharibacillus sp. JS10]